MSNTVFKDDYFSSLTLELKSILPILPDTEIEAISSIAASVRKIVEGTVVVAQDHTPQEVYLALTGKFQITRHGAKGQSLVTGKAVRGDFFGDAGALLEMPHSASVIAIEDSQVVIFDAAHFVEKLSSCPQLSLYLLRSSARNIFHADHHRLELISSDPPSRLIKYLREIGEELPDGSTHIHELPTHARLACDLGVTRESLTRALKLLRSTGEIVSFRRTVEVKKRS